MSLSEFLHFGREVCEWSFLSIPKREWKRPPSFPVPRSPRLHLRGIYLGKSLFGDWFPLLPNSATKKFWKQTGHLLPLGLLDFIRAVVRIQLWDEGSLQAPWGAWRTQTHPFIPQIPSFTYFYFKSGNTPNTQKSTGNTARFSCVHCPDVKDVNILP